jgi:S-adenosylmethionine hydrolase
MIVGSFGFIEVAMNRGSAADRLEVSRGLEFEVETDRRKQ